VNLFRRCDEVSWCQEDGKAVSIRHPPRAISTQSRTICSVTPAILAACVTASHSEDPGETQIESRCCDRPAGEGCLVESGRAEPT
jgi:hypothetical protein